MIETSLYHSKWRPGDFERNRLFTTAKNSGQISKVTYCTRALVRRLPKLAITLSPSGVQSKQEHGLRTDSG